MNKHIFKRILLVVKQRKGDESKITKISFVYLSHEINMLQDDRDRRDAVNDLLSGYGGSVNIVIGAGMVIVEGSDGRTLVGPAVGIDLSFSYGKTTHGSLDSYRDQSPVLLQPSGADF